MLILGAKAVAVPGFLSGLYRAFERFSSKHLTWRQLVAPTIELCVRGVTVSAELAADLQQFYSLISNEPLMRWVSKPFRILNIECLLQKRKEISGHMPKDPPQGCGNVPLLLP